MLELDFCQERLYIIEDYKTKFNLGLLGYCLSLFFQVTGYRSLVSCVLALTES